MFSHLSSAVRLTGIILVAPLIASAQPQQMIQEDFEDQGDYYTEQDQAREAQAEANFDSIMIPQNIPSPAEAAVPEAAVPLRANLPPPRKSGKLAQDHMRELVDLLQTTTEPSVEIPLREYSAVSKKLGDLDKKNQRLQGPGVVLGSAEYSGQAIQGALDLQLNLQVTLGRPDQWKTVPLIGDDVVLVKATVGGKSIPVSRRAGYHVWVTRQTGEATVIVDLLVPARGPRGSIEYDFLVDRTPVTRFSCRFPVPNLEPRLDKAVQSEVRPEGGDSLLTAVLRPTTRIHLVGFRDLGEAEGRKAKVHAESLNLLSLDEGSLDLFTVIRYTILYAGTKEFLIQVPKGMSVVSADGEGAFRFMLEKNDLGTLIKGETAFPIRKNYEISLRLRRESPKEGETFDVPVPRCTGVELERGWLGVEVPGKLLLEEEAISKEVLELDPRQLPEEMIRSAVSPILRAYRYHSHLANIRLSTVRLPEKEPESGSIDRIRAFTTVTQEGNVMTEMRITLRNRLRHSLTLAVPADTKVLSTHLDGQKVKPSQSEQGRILLPLKRSTGTDRLQAFTISVVMESKLPSMGWLGFPDLNLPAVDLPVSSMVWSVFLPARNLYTSLEGDIEQQVYTGRGTWHQPSYSYEPPTWQDVPQAPGTAGIGTVGPVASAHTGAMPVRIKLPQHGKRLEYSRYWIEKNHPVQVGFVYASSWLRIPAWMALAVLLALGILLISTRFQRLPAAVLPWLGGAVVLVAIWPLNRLGGKLAVFLGILLGFLAIAIKRGLFTKGPSVVVDWWRSLPRRFRKREIDKAQWRPGRLLLRICITIGLCFFGLILLEEAWRLLMLLMNPL